MNPSFDSASSTDNSAPGAVPSNRLPPALWIGAGVLVLALGAGAAGLALKRSATAPQNVAAIDPANSLAANERIESSRAAEQPLSVAPAAQPQPQEVAVVEKPMPVHRSPSRTHSTRTANAAQQPAPVEVAKAPVCADCGVVESVQPIRIKGQGTGLGAVAGGVAGGLIGHQIGGGKGKTAMTVLGAVGGGFAGNAIEKNVRAKTVYDVRIRMDDGTLRTLRQAAAPAVGAKVQVEGSTLKPLPA